ncbi:hypothetical protein [Nocardioides donggukensis]|uniref:Peptidase MA-like domain-containing protein n=1 Tax=Nocardioides donggukensis TaxID=2774019 RepID=A0A927K5N8_9ACTN|nr:hypothetical protein [Nocardioides donggukensis]MBD8869600.1 hypothetical protein [Nocardioides donggukensis]
MSTGRTEPPRRRGPIAAALSAVLVLGALTSCTPSEVLQEVTPEADPAVVASEQVRELLRRRSGAVRDGDLSTFLRDVSTDRARFERRQRRYFHNLRELPLGRFRHRLGGAPRLGPDGRVEVVVSTRMQLAGFDRHPVTTPALFTFAPDGDGGLVLTSDRDAGFNRQRDIEPAPWDITRIEVQRGDGVLGVFDTGSVGASEQIIDAVEDGIAAVGSAVPLEWDRKVVLYALSDIRVLAELDNLPGGDPDRLDGVTFPVRGGPDGDRLAGTRFMLHPRMVDRNDDVRDRLIRHELTHVALGSRDDRVPTWLSEGLAEYVSVRPVPEFERRISRDAVAAARAGVVRLPAGSSFNGPKSGANYGIAWYACEHVADAYGEPALWRLLDAMRAGSGTRESDQGAVLREVIGVRGTDLAGAAGAKILATFG